MKRRQWPSVNPSDLRHPIDIQQQSTTNDAAGQPLAAWATVVSVRGGVETALPGESIVVGSLTAEVTHLWKVRYPRNFSIAPGMRVQFINGAITHYYRIQAVINLQERNLILTLKCIELFGVS